ncbi:MULTISPECIES: TM2 domain-containing protein [Devosia]|uniref:TM2 domain-containing protein n=1 Tax=Devosia TaxID=46913 RepID=UPI000CE94CF1|nr:MULTISPECIES: TM2 domain-containing protein [Devosia]AVF05541.1 TM2 domain-containing protein [Devosia sp. I507]
MASNLDKYMLVEARVANEQKSTGVAYALWFFLGILSLHRFYLGRPGTAILQILSYFIIVGFLWWIIDAFLIPSMVDKHRDKVRSRITGELAAFN